MSADQTWNAYAAGEVRAILARNRLTARDLAERMGVKRMWVQYRLAETTPMQLDDLQRIAAALGVEVAALLPAAAEAQRRSGLSPGSAHMPSRPRAARLMEVAHRGGNAPPSSNRTNDDADNTVPIRHSRAPVRLCAGVTR